MKKKATRLVQVWVVSPTFGDLVGNIPSLQVLRFGFECQQLIVGLCSLYLYIKLSKRIISEFPTNQKYEVLPESRWDATIITLKKGSHTSHLPLPIFLPKKKVWVLSIHPYHSSQARHMYGFYVNLYLQSNYRTKLHDGSN